jgi:MOSC domain-containing protein YiiM
MSAEVISVSRSPSHGFSKQVEPALTLLAGLGVEGDAHLGTTTQHLYRMRIDPTLPNLCQVHLLHSEVFDEVRAKGYEVVPGQLGENVCTRGLDLLGLPTGTKLAVGDEVLLEVTGIRNPCKQINAHRAGLMDALLDRAEDGSLIRKAGIMSIVLQGGTVKPGDQIVVTLPPEPHRPLEPV